MLLPYSFVLLFSPKALRLSTFADLLQQNKETKSTPTSNNSLVSLCFNVVPPSLVFAKLGERVMWGDMWPSTPPEEMTLRACPLLEVCHPRLGAKADTVQPRATLLCSNDPGGSAAGRLQRGLASAFPWVLYLHHGSGAGHCVSSSYSCVTPVMEFLAWPKTCLVAMVCQAIWTHYIEPSCHLQATLPLMLVCCGTCKNSPTNPTPWSVWISLLSLYVHIISSKTHAVIQEQDLGGHEKGK